MTQRTAWQHRRVEVKSKLTTWVANRVFSFKENGIDGWLKRRMLKPAQKPNPSSGPSGVRQDR
jgi:hypothetical protein